MEWGVPGLHLLRPGAAGGRGAAAGLLAELHQGLVVLLLLLLLLLVARQDKEEAQDALQVAIPDLCGDESGREASVLCSEAPTFGSTCTWSLPCMEQIHFLGVKPFLRVK